MHFKKGTIYDENVEKVVLSDTKEFHFFVSLFLIAQEEFTVILPISEVNSLINYIKVVSEAEHRNVICEKLPTGTEEGFGCLAFSSKIDKNIICTTISYHPLFDPCNGGFALCSNSVVLMDGSVPGSVYNALALLGNKVSLYEIAD